MQGRPRRTQAAGAEYGMDTCAMGSRGGVGLGEQVQPAVGRVVVRTPVGTGRGEERAVGSGGEKRPPKAASDQGVQEKGRRGEQSRLGMGRGAEGGEGRTLGVGEGGPRAT